MERVGGGGQRMGSRGFVIGPVLIAQPLSLTWNAKCKLNWSRQQERSSRSNAAQLTPLYTAANFTNCQNNTTCNHLKLKSINSTHTKLWLWLKTETVYQLRRFS